jgi:putative endonuclease
MDQSGRALTDKTNLGKAGERLALAYLKSKGFKILEKNLRTRFGELDIIANDHGTLVFVEVKTRTSSVFGSPIQGVTKQKKARLRNLALRYLADKGLSETEVRFDVLGILQTKDQIQIEHIPNAF